VTKKKNTRAPSSYYRKALGNGRSTPILFFIWECLSSKPDKRLKRAESLIKPWSPAFRSPSRLKQNAPWQISNGSKPHPGMLLGVKRDRRPSECFVVSDYPAGRTRVN